MSAVRIIRGVLALPFRGLGWLVLLVSMAGVGLATALGLCASLIAGP